ncbi:hypothetical protein F5Y15DRAFT_140470 [Xylariaceae sp. FL0016]|nr:hypothetical protein F5Y15DRAFT_140470 [Xylariaceae sp. FL0016]
MRFSKPIKSSAHCVPSPDGTLVATLAQSNITIRAADSLRTIRKIKLSPEISGGVSNFSWSPSSSRILMTAVDQLHVFAVPTGDFHASVRIPTSLGTKSTFVDFGATDNEVCIWSPFGIKLTIVALAPSKAVEITNPKLYTALSASRGCSFRPETLHMALLTRTAGKDMISIHTPGTRELQRSWTPDTIDAQGLAWTPDGRWLAVWESPSQGHRVLFYTSDGHLFKDWRGPISHAPVDMGLEYGAGVRLLQFSPNGRHAAVADGSRGVCVLNGQSLVEEMRLRHNQTIQPKDTLQIWQEEAKLPNAGAGPTTFVKADQAVMPPVSPSANAQDARSGCNLAKFDFSSSLLATRLEEAPSTVWIWDVPTCELRAVLIYHANVSKIDWHPTQPELLLIRCEGERYAGLVFVWDPLSHGPRSIDFTHHLLGENLSGKVNATWLGNIAESATLFFADCASWVLLSLAETDDSLSWQEQSGLNKQTDYDSLSDLIPAPRKADTNSDMDEDMSELGEADDTFYFKKRLVP